MPRRYKKKRVYKKRRNAMGHSRKVIPYLLGDKFVGRFKYIDDYSMDPAAWPAVATRVFVANGMYDPDFTGAGHQPRGFDQIHQMFDHHVVLGVKIRAVFPPVGEPYVCGIIIRDTGTPILAALDYREARHCKWMVVSPNSMPKTLIMNVNPNKFLGRSKPLSDPDLKGSVSANPQEKCYLHVFVGGIISGINPGAVPVSVQLDFLSAFIEPNIPLQS